MCNMFHKIIEHQDAIQSFIMFLGIIASAVLSLYLHNLSKKETYELHEISKKENHELYKLSNEEKQKDFLNAQLFELQRLSFYDPYLENDNYTKEWDSLKGKYQNDDLLEDEKNKFIKYDIYTEMLFNFIYKSLEFYKTKEKMEEFVDFKSWVNTHKAAWKNPLQTNSNKDVYGEEMFNLVNSWIDW